MLRRTRSAAPASVDVLDSYQAVAVANGPKDRRFRIEHSQRLRPPSIPRFFYAAVTRATIDGANPGGWLPNQKISSEQALTA